MPTPDLTRARWRVSARSNGASTCVQAAILNESTPWRVSDRSNGANTCVQAAILNVDTPSRVSDRSNGSSTCVQAAVLDGSPDWRVSDRSNGATTCVEAATDGAIVALQNSNDPHPGGPVLTVPARDWVRFLGHVTAGDADREAVTTSAAFGPLVVGRAGDGRIEVRCAGEAGSPVVRYTPQEWDVFVAGATRDHEFTLDWLLSAGWSVLAGLCWPIGAG
jgi:hypothetical protein